MLEELAFYLEFALPPISAWILYSAFIPSARIPFNLRAPIIKLVFSIMILAQ